MSRNLAAASLRLSLEADHPTVNKKTKNSKKQNNKKEKNFGEQLKKKRSKKNTKAKKDTEGSQKILERNLKLYQESLEKSKSIDHAKLMETLLLGQRITKQKVNRNEAMDDDMDFGKSILFDDEEGANGEESDGEGGGFGEWNKTSKKKERQIIFERKK